MRKEPPQIELFRRDPRSPAVVALIRISSGVRARSVQLSEAESCREKLHKLKNALLSPIKLLQPVSDRPERTHR